MARTPPQPALHLDRVGFAHPGQPPLASEWSAQLTPGVTLLLGDTGSGKTTLLRVLAGEQHVGEHRAGEARASGRLTLNGIALDQDERAYREHVCWLNLETDAHDQAMVTTLPGILGVDPAGWTAHAQAFGLGPHLAKPLYMLSSGSRRKVWLAAALASARALTLLDEPTGALDAPSIAHLMRALAEVAERRERIVVVASSQALPDSVSVGATFELPIQGGATLTR